MPASTIPLTLTPQSSQIHGYGYDAPNQLLAVEYNSNWQRMTYHYIGVPAEVADALSKAESVGSFIYKQVKGKYEFAYMPKDTPQQAAGS